MKIKTKLSLGMAFIYANVLALAILSNYYIFKLSSDSEAILEDNYKTLQYCGNMALALDRIKSDSIAFKNFEENLNLQEANITEPGEKEFTSKLAINFEKLKANPRDSNAYYEIRQGIHSIEKLNQSAIERKNEAAKGTANSGRIWLGMLGSILIILMLTFVVNFPGYIADPIKILTDGIKEIAAKNYSQRIHLEKNDEFGELADAFNAMAQKLDDYENSNLAKIIFEKKRIETIINNMKDPLVGLNEKNKILFANTAAIKVLNMDEKELIGKYAPDVAVKNDLLRSLINPETGITPFKIYADEKESYFVKEVLKIMAEEQPIGEVIMLHNITHFKELDLAKTNFIATVSHELKTPISSIKVGLKLLEDQRIGQTNEEQKQLIHGIKEDAERLLKITGELLDMAQVETGKIHLNIQDAEPEKIVSYATEATQFQAQQKKLEYEINIAPNLPKVNADIEKTAWVMINLLSNAIRYSSENSKIIIEAKPRNNTIAFSVRDFGKGIDPKYKSKIFDRYFRVPGTIKEGTGLGLAISKEFIEAQGGKIGVESEPGKGSTFFFSLNKI